jgi:hypothetical protein
MNEFLSKKPDTHVPSSSLVVPPTRCLREGGREEGEEGGVKRCLLYQPMKDGGREGGKEGGRKGRTGVGGNPLLRGEADRALHHIHARDVMNGEGGREEGGREGGREGLPWVVGNPLLRGEADRALHHIHTRDVVNREEAAPDGGDVGEPGQDSNDALEVVLDQRVRDAVGEHDHLPTQL